MAARELRGLAVVVQHVSLVAGLEDAPQPGPVGLGQHGRTEPGGDVRGDGVGLLGGEAALLDEVVGGVAGRIDVGEPAHAAVVVDRDEAERRRAGDPVDARAADKRQRHDARVERAPGRRQPRAAVHDVDRLPARELDARGRQEAGDLRGRVRPEHLQRVRLRRDEHELDRDGARRRVAGGQQREP